MDILKKVFLSFVVLLITFNISFALVLEGDINLDKATNNSLTLSWEPVDWALGYFVYYDTVSHEEDKWYSNSTNDIIDWTWVTLEWLSSATDYYIALRVVDGEWNEWEFSKEFAYSTLAESDSNGNLYIDNVTAINKNKVIVTFNVDIDKNKDIEFKIEDKNNNIKEIAIDNVSVNWNQVELWLSNNLEANKTYTLTVISLTWINWETIKAWVDWVIDFDTGTEIELNSASEEDTYSQEAPINEDNNQLDTKISNEDNNQEENIENVDLNSAWPEINSWTTALSWANLANEDIKKTAELAAKKSEKLPQTGPTEWLLLILALWLAFAIMRFKKA